jgi:uncharacterized protein (DUF3084 family)
MAANAENGSSVRPRTGTTGKIAASDERIQRVYAKHRLPEIVRELRELRDETQKLMEARGRADLIETDRKKTNQRLQYVRMRMDVLRQEQDSLRQALGQPQQPTPKNKN